MKYLLDTHVWIWARLAPELLSTRARDAIVESDACDELLLSAISPWEFSLLLRKNRIEISCQPEDWIDRALRMPKMRLVPLTPTIAYRSTVLPDGFGSDPADQIIIAAARNENATLITKDSKILDYPHVRSLW